MGIIREYIIKISDEIMEEEIADRPEELIRCKDCRHYVPRKSIFSSDIQFFKCSILDTDTDPNWFCACGERMK